MSLSFSGHPPDHSPLPAVSQESMQVVSAEFADNPTRETEVLRQMQRENPILAEGIGRVVLTLGEGNKEATNAILTAAMMLYSCLGAQADANIMNENFSLSQQEDQTE